MLSTLFVCCIFAALCSFSCGKKGNATLEERFLYWHFMNDVNRTGPEISRKYNQSNTTDRPNKCQVCRVLAQELSEEIDKTKEIKKSYTFSYNLDDVSPSARKIDYGRSEMRIMDILDVVCKNVLNYRWIPGPEFPFLKNVKSIMRQELEKTMARHGRNISRNSPEEMLADPTGDIRRMSIKCDQMVEEYEEEIIDWYMNNQEESPIDFLCARRVLDTGKQGCLTASTDIPEGEEAPVKFTEDETKSTTFAYESRIKKDL